MNKGSKYTGVEVGKITSLFSGPVAVCVATPEMFSAPLWQEEMKLVANVVEKRRREFTAGRTASRQALLTLGSRPGPILSNCDRTPIWPNGFVGSISHCDGFCAAVVAKRKEIISVGFDVELADPLSDEVANLVCDRSEWAGFAQLPLPTNSDWGKLSFSAKEAFYKCYYSHTRTFIDFHDVSIHFLMEPSGDQGRFSVEIKDESKRLQNASCVGRWLLMDQMIFSGMTLLVKP